MIVRSFSGYRPSARSDGRPWVAVRIDEGPGISGPWTVIDTVTSTQWLPSGLDPDPTSPAARSFTTELAALERGWYRVAFVDATGDTDQPTTPVSAYGASGFDAAMVRAKTTQVNYTILGYPLGIGADPLEDLVIQAVSVLEQLTGRVPLSSIPTDFPGGAVAYMSIAQRAVALSVVQIAYGVFGDNLSMAASGIQSFSVPGYSEQRSNSSSSSQKSPVTNPWDTLWQLIWLLMTPEKREEWLAMQRGEDAPFMDIVEIEVPGAGLSDPYTGIW